MSIGSRNRFAIASAAEAVFATPINITASGVSERLVFTGGTLAAGGTEAIAYAVISGGVIQSVYVVHGGSYSVIPTNVVQPAGGSGATFTPVGSGTVTSVTVGGSGGTGYSVASTGTAKSFPVRMDRPVVNIETATDEDTLTGTLEAGLNSIVVKQTITASTELDCRLDALGILGRFALGNVSRVYLTLLTLSGGTGQVTAAEVYAVIRDGVAVDYVIANPGSYTAIPTTVTAITGSTNATFTLSGTTSVTGVTITSAGANLNAVASQARLLQFSGGGGSGCVAITKLPTAGSLSAPRAYVVNGGSGYTSAPTVTVPGGGTGISYTATVSNGVVTALTGSGTSGTAYTNAAGLYAHTMTVGTGDSPAATLYFQDPFSGFASTTAHQYAGCNVQRLTLRSEAGGKITLSAEFLGSGVHTLSQTITGMPSISTEGILGASRISQFLIDGTDLKAYLKSFEITFENQFDEAAEMASGSKTLPSIERTGTTVTGSFAFKADSSVAGTATDIITAILGNSTTHLSDPVDISLRIEGVTAGHICDISLPNAILDNTAITGQRGKLEKPVGFKGFYDTVSSRASQLVVANTTRSYLA